MDKIIIEKGTAEIGHLLDMASCLNYIRDTFLDQFWDIDLDNVLEDTLVLDRNLINSYANVRIKNPLNYNKEESSSVISESQYGGFQLMVVKTISPEECSLYITVIV